MLCDNDQIISLSLCDTPIDFGIPTELTRRVARQVGEFLLGKRQKFDLPFRLIGTEFQKRVFRAICEIPYGEVRSYGDIAAEIGNPKAARAVGGATNKSSLMFIVPCHRVIGGHRALGGFGNNIALKIVLLRHEGHTIDAKNLKIIL